jgi:hypothetical protein
MPRKTRAKKPNKQSKVAKALSPNNPMWAHDSALLDRSFPDTQIWNQNSQHEPRFGQANSKDNKIYNIVQTCVNRAWLTSSTSGPAGQAKTFQMAYDVNQSGTLLSLFDQYRIMQVEVWLKPSTNLYANTNIASLYTAIDYDDVTIPSTEAQMQQYTNVTITGLNDGVYRRFRPHIASTVYQAGVASGYANVKSEWIDAASSTVSHYGFKALVSTVSSSNINYDLIFRLWCQFRNVF